MSPTGAAIAPTTQRTSIFRSQPFKSLYLIYQLITIALLRYPSWLARAAIPALRPRRKWTMRRALDVYTLRHWYRVLQKTGPYAHTPDHRALETGKHVLGEWIEPVDDSFVVAEVKRWAGLVGAQPVRLPTYWNHKQGSKFDVGARAVPGEKVVYALHGGGYTSLSAHPSDPTSEFAKGLVQHIPSVHRSLSLEYRVSSGPPESPTFTNPFPTALIDALSGYTHLVNHLGFSPKNIIFAGDSAGGNLALALVRYVVRNYGQDVSRANKLRRAGIKSLAPPGYVVLSSPWTDLSSSHDKPGSSLHTLLDVDFILPSDIPTAVRKFTGPHGMLEAETNLYMSPATLDPSVPERGRFKGFPKTFIIGGGAECLVDSIRTLDRLMKQDGEGEERIRYQEAKDGVHDFMVLHSGEPERTEVFKEIAKWVDRET